MHVPAGKAIAIAAMPTAVLMGMGLTPTLAQAKPLPKNPFQDGPCVTAPDEAGKADGKKDQKDDTGKDDAKDGATPTPSPSSGGASGDPSGGPSSGPSDPDSGSGSDGDTSPTPKPSAPAESGAKDPAPSPSPSKTTNPLDPLGLGDAISDLLTPGDKKSASPTPTPSASAPAKDTKDDPQDNGGGLDKVTKPVEDTVDKVTDAAKDAADAAKDTADQAKESATPTPTPSASDPLAPDENGKKPFPCVVEDKVAGDAERPPATIPNQPWNLEASSLLLKGLDYVGVVNLTMPNGQTKQALKFTADDGVDIGDLHQIVDGPGGKRYHVQAAKGSTSTIRNGRVTMYTERLEGNLFGLIPIVFDPEHPPPLDIPIAYFTKVKIIQAGQFGGDLTIPGLHQSITG
ncbi:hypothetical protein ACFVT5_30150 [Streptomyces sp. NPDC058001]|uniref:hypothetical protein n=1 Tax=Streptomyces sp. NPDC058001 TaxID=3346300 RepID=UPI0036E38CDF